jgi:multiple sugar transport system substrate-binding protein
LLAGCATGTGGQTESSGVGEVPADTSATVRILMEAVPDTDIVQGLVADFNSEYPDITIEIETLGFDQMRDKLIASFQSSMPTYDLIVVDNPWMDDFVARRFLEPNRRANRQHS